MSGRRPGQFSRATRGAAATVDAVPELSRAGDVRPIEAGRVRQQAWADRFAVLAVVVVVSCYGWVVSAGRLAHWPVYGAYYNELADGFARGQTALLLEPSPALLALPDPYDPAVNEGFRFHDAVLFDGRYYLYWGPVPAVLLAAYKAVSSAGSDLPVGDQSLVFAFACGLVVAAALLLGWVRARLFPHRPAWTMAAGVGLVGLVGPVPFTLARADVYEAAILGGQCFLLLGLFAALRGLFPAPRPASRSPAATASVRPAGRRRRIGNLPRGTVWLVGAAVCWSAAVGCRLSLVPAVVALAGLTLWQAVRPTGGERPPGKRPSSGGPPSSCGGWRPDLGRWPAVVAFALPAAAAAVGLGAYNRAGFGSWTETGWRYQLAGIHIGRAADRGELMAPRFVPPNLLRYAFEPPRWAGEFPYAHASAGRLNGLLRPYADALPKQYNCEWVVGVAWTAPVLLAGLLALWPGLWRRNGVVAPADGDATRADPATPAADGRAPPDGPAFARWLVASLLAAAALGFLPALSLGGSTMRYLVDLTPPLAVLAVIGLWLGVPAAAGRRHRPKRWARWTWTAGVGVVAAYSVVVSGLLSFTGYLDHFENNNWPVIAAARSALPSFGGPPPAAGTTGGATVPHNDQATRSAPATVSPASSHSSEERDDSDRPTGPSRPQGPAAAGPQGEQR